MIDFNLYDYTLDNSGWEMDDLHIRMLFDAVMESGPSVVTEIGSYRGRSAIAYIEALKAGADFTLNLVDPVPRDSLLRLVEESGFSANILIHDKPYWELLIPSDFVFIDGDHTWPALADTLAAVALGTPVIAMHDTRAHEHGYRGVWGSHMAAKILREVPGRAWSEDAEKREGMRTQRGFGISRLSS